MPQSTRASRLGLLLALLIAAGPGLSSAANDPPKRASGDVLIADEWFADIPWRQKLSTNDSNLIDVPFALPYEAIPKDLKGCKGVADEVGEARCILRHGIANVIGFHRTDTLYKPKRSGEPGEAPEVEGQSCDDGDCVEMRIEIQRFHTQTDEPCKAALNSATDTPCQADVVTNDGNQGGPQNPDLPPTVPSFGFAITEATIFAPWRPWYMGHYCGYDQTDGGIDDSVCYESYFTTQLQGFTNLAGGEKWPADRGILFYPQDDKEKNSVDIPVLFGLYCTKGSKSCPMYIGKVDWKGNEIEDLSVEPEDLRDEVIRKTERLDTNFDGAIADFTDLGRFAWGGKGNPRGDTLPGAPYLGFYGLKLHGAPIPETGKKGSRFQASHYVLPKECTKQDYAKARRGQQDGIDALDDCAVTFELHTSGFFDQWQHLFPDGTSKQEMRKEIYKGINGITLNQYGRTNFLMAGLREQKIAAPFFLEDKDRKEYISGLSLYDQIYGSSLYTQYLPMVHPDGNAKVLQNYGDNLWHAFFMSNHMNQSPEHFIRGVRGRILWHNEFRSNLLYQSHMEGHSKGTRFEGVLAHRDFPAGFQPNDHQVPFHGNTCDSCHVRNGSGIPLAPNGSLPNIHTARGINGEYKLNPDYTYSNGMHKNGDLPIIPSMKIVLFDLKEPSPRRTAFCDADDHTTPASAEHAQGGFYNNKIMNFYGNTFQVNLRNGRPTYDLRYVDIGSEEDEEAGEGAIYEIVDPAERTRHTRDGFRTYVPKRVVVSNFDNGDRCTSTASDLNPDAPKDADWPTNCDDVSGAAIEEAINGGEIGFLHLLGKRLGNTPLIEMMPDEQIKDAQRSQKANLGKHAAGCYDLSAGTRSGWSLSDHNYRSCRSGRLGSSGQDCYIGRWGWIGDRASLEDQVANAAHVEQNITSVDGYDMIHQGTDPDSPSELVRYKGAMCGPADLKCQRSGGANSDITEQEVRDMATYQRWIGIPQRSEFQVDSTKTQAGERLFRSDELGCNHCHTIDKIPFVEKDNMLPDEERAKLSKLSIRYNGEADYPFVSYLGTDLLLHDMGYLSQIAKGPAGKTMRDEDTGAIKSDYRAYFQYIRTPPLKGLRFNRFVTDSHHNKPRVAKGLDSFEARAGCDFLLHDGRACDAIEAAFLHDGPAVKEIGMISALSALTLEELDQLRAFLYSL